ncbi:hypothetical protein PBAL39_21380 [Pedobacter sp. BAL39]|uniref:DUF4199 domain-containing protein n=1 Tax=Pedobacter sp. BAL39 TaxID=391596 RepID=UPI0001559B76|nr:DUF4199 domain-containing protein [Pedobacter sp. BAL39]EDM38667.1 hypothetical protein PBAL39_21380 [Pedobacter sp. BAL39]
MEEKTLGEKKTLNTMAATNGVIIAIVTLVLSLVIHFIDPVLPYTSLLVQLFSFVVFIGLLVYAGTSIRKELGGFWTFGDAFKSFLIIALILAAVTTVYNVVLMTVIDPELPKKAAVAIEESQRSMMARFGATEEQIEEALAQGGNMEERLRITPKNVVTSFGVGLAIYGIIALIMAAILKKNPPLFKPTTED